MQARSAVSAHLAPTGKLRLGVLMLSYFAVEDAASGELAGVIPDLGRELARRLDVPCAPVHIANPQEMIAAFRRGGEPPMPFTETCRMEERIRMLSDYDSWNWSVADLCRRFGVCRDTFYEWRRRALDQRLESAAVAANDE